MCTNAAVVKVVEMTQLINMALANDSKARLVVTGVGVA